MFDWAVYEDDEIGREVMAQYRVPSIFGEDLFSLLEERQHSDYPSYRSEKQYVFCGALFVGVYIPRERERERACSPLCEPQPGQKQLAPPVLRRLRISRKR